ncbi:MAG: hypothetical protein ACXWL2_01635 [Candidatus Chromulinivorax sp.]
MQINFRYQFLFFTFFFFYTQSSSYSCKHRFTSIETMQQLKQAERFALQKDSAENHVEFLYSLYKRGLAPHLLLRARKASYSQEKNEKINAASLAVNDFLDVMPLPGSLQQIARSKDPQVYGPVQQEMFEVLLKNKQLWHNSLYYQSYAIQSTRGYN